MPRYGWTEKRIINGQEMIIHFDGDLPFSRVEPCDYCKRKHEFLCDWEIAPGKTCDKKLCRLHTRKVFGDPDKDFCPDCLEKYKRQLEGRDEGCLIDTNTR